jgi:hypothetical protein
VEEIFGGKDSADVVVRSKESICTELATGPGESTREKPRDVSSIAALGSGMKEKDEEFSTEFCPLSIVRNLESVTGSMGGP